MLVTIDDLNMGNRRIDKGTSSSQYCDVVDKMFVSNVDQEIVIRQDVYP
jgi:hypothetical protein